MLREFVALAGIAAVVSGAVQLEALSVPTHVDIRQDATLVCNFTLTGANLYSVKWYKDEQEFYRYMPDNVPAGQAFREVPGVTLDEERCTMNSVTLINLTLKSSGAYRCEVSLEGPSFDTAYLTSNLTVTALPLHGPRIEGVRMVYLPGDLLTANCTAAPSIPAANVSWFINGAPSELWTESPTPAVTTTSQGLQSVTMGLRLPAEHRFFQDGGRMRLRCVATVNDLTWQSEADAFLGELGTQRLQQGPGNNSASFVSVREKYLLLPFVIAGLQCILS